MAEGASKDREERTNRTVMINRPGRWFCWKAPNKYPRQFDDAVDRLCTHRNLWQDFVIYILNGADDARGDWVGVVRNESLVSDPC